jgi:hypothetical protein
MIHGRPWRIWDLFKIQEITQAIATCDGNKADQDATPPGDIACVVVRQFLKALEALQQAERICRVALANVLRGEEGIDPRRYGLSCPRMADG